MADSPLHRLTAALKSKIRGCTTPRPLGDAGDEIVKKENAPISDTPTAYSLNAAAAPSPAAQQPLMPAAIPAPRPPEGSMSDEDGAVDVGPRIFSELGKKPGALSSNVDCEWLFSRSERPPSSSSRLPPVDHPADKLQAALAMLSISSPRDPEWALTTLRQLALHSPAVLRPRLGEAVLLVLQYVCSPLPGLAHAAIVLLAELLAAFGDCMAPHCQDRKDSNRSVVLQLLLRAQAGPGAKAFVVEGAQLALRALTQNLSPSVAKELLQPYTCHKQPCIRAKAVALLERVEKRAAEEAAEGSVRASGGHKGSGSPLAGKVMPGEQFIL